MIEFQYFDGCPNSTATLNNLMQLKDELKIDENEIRIVAVPDLELAEKLHFQGSPTILIDGIDIYTNQRPNSYSYNCRIYNISGIKTGIISKEYIREKIKQYRMSAK
jgi:hypothetical protein